MLRKNVDLCLKRHARTLGLVFVGIALTACQGNKNFDSSVKLSSGQTVAASSLRETVDPEFNAFLYLKNFSKVEYSQRASYTVDREKYYQGKYYTLNIQHVVRAWFNDSVQADAKDKEEFLGFLDRVKHSNLASDVRFAETASGFGYYADNGRCIVARFAKRVKSRTSFDNDFGAPDTLAELVTCRGLTVSPEEFLSLLDFADAGDLAQLRQLKRKAVANPVTDEKAGARVTRSFTAKWEGYTGGIQGALSLYEKDGKGIVSFTLPDAHGKCTGNYQFDKTGTGSWKAACERGLTASGSFEALGKGKGSTGEGVDSLGRSIRYTIAGS